MRKYESNDSSVLDVLLLYTKLGLLLLRGWKQKKTVPTSPSAAQSNCFMFSLAMNRSQPNANAISAFATVLGHSHQSKSVTLTMQEFWAQNSLPAIILPIGHMEISPTKMVRLQIVSALFSIPNDTDVNNVAYNLSKFRRFWSSPRPKHS